MRVLTLLALLPATALAVPLEFSHQGRLFDSGGAPLTGACDLDFEIYDTTSGGTALWSESISTTCDDGYFAVTLGQGSAIDDTIFDAGDVLYLSVAVNSGAAFPTRLPMVSVPYAVRAGGLQAGSVVNASEIQINGSTVIDSTGALAADVDWTDIQNKPAVIGETTCADDEVLAYASGSWSCMAPTSFSLDAGQLAAGTIDLARIPVGDTSGTVAAGDHTHPSASFSAAGTVDPDNFLEVNHNLNTEAVLATGWWNDSGTWRSTQASVARVCPWEGKTGTATVISFDTTIDTDSGPLVVDSFTLQAGALLTLTGSAPFIIESAGPIDISGNIQLSGADGDATLNAGERYARNVGGTPGPGGFGGGDGTDRDSDPEEGDGVAGSGPGGGGGATFGGRSVNNCNYGEGGGGGGYGSAGATGADGPGCNAGDKGAGGVSYAGIASGLLQGGSGGGGGAYGNAANSNGGAGGGGGGVIKLVAPTIDISGNIFADGGDGGGIMGDSLDGGGGGGGSGGAIWLQANAVTLGTNVLSVAGGAGGVTFCAGCDGGDGGAGGDGVIRIDSPSVTNSPAGAVSNLDACSTTVRADFEMMQPDANNVRLYNRADQALDLRLIVARP